MVSDPSIIALNFAVCTIGGFLSMCRMTKMSASATKPSIRWQYVCWFCAFVASGWSFLFDSGPTTSQVVVSLLMVCVLLLGLSAWRGHEAPEYTRRVA
jgi:hypothetical protein